MMLEVFMAMKIQVIVMW